MIDLRSLRPNNLTSPQFSHLLWVLYWPAYGIAFGALEFLRPAADCFSVHCRVDDLIPFCEYFFIPYLFWFVFLVGMNVYLALWEPKSFRKFMHFVAFTYTLTLLIYVVWPTKQDLRPTEFVRDNFFIHLAQAFYNFDTNTNVCPSLHVIGSMAVVFGAWDSQRFSSGFWKWAFFLTGMLINISVCFVKQHSFIDLVGGLLMSLLGYVLVYKLPKKEKVHE